MEPTHLKAGQGGECRRGWVIALWMAFSSVSGLNGARCVGGKKDPWVSLETDTLTRPLVVVACAQPALASCFVRGLVRVAT